MRSCRSTAVVRPSELTPRAGAFAGFSTYRPAFVTSPRPRFPLAGRDVGPRASARRRRRSNTSSGSPVPKGIGCGTGGTLRPSVSMIADRAALMLLGDLDPHDMVVWLGLRFGGIGPGRGAPVNRLRYMGIDDSWIDICEPMLRPKFRRGGIEDLAIPLSSFEERCLSTLRQMPVDWEKAVGSRCWGILCSGRKLELDAFSNPLLYSARLGPVLARRLASRTGRSFVDLVVSNRLPDLTHPTRE